MIKKILTAGAAVTAITASTFGAVPAHAATVAAPKCTGPATVTLTDFMNSSKGYVLTCNDVNTEIVVGDGALMKNAVTSAGTLASESAYQKVGYMTPDIVDPYWYNTTTNQSKLRIYANMDGVLNLNGKTTTTCNYVRTYGYAAVNAAGKASLGYFKVVDNTGKCSTTTKTTTKTTTTTTKGMVTTPVVYQVDYARWTDKALANQYFAMSRDGLLKAGEGKKFWAAIHSGKKLSEGAIFVTVPVVHKAGTTVTNTMAAAAMQKELRNRFSTNRYFTTTKASGEEVVIWRLGTGANISEPFGPKGHRVAQQYIGHFNVNI